MLPKFLVLFAELFVEGLLVVELLLVVVQLGDGGEEDLCDVKQHDE